jgi:3-dehydro-L-gulonate-6-phosphate decarboxylase
MSSIPLLQVALDYTSLPSALAMALTVAPAVDIIEIGTPLCKAAGMEAVRAVREVCPDKLILADVKSPDVGGLEAQMAFDAGADMMTVIGGAPLATVQAALDVARQRGKDMLMELTGVRDIIARAQEWRQIGVERVVYHRGWDEQAANREWAQDDLAVIGQLIDIGFKLTVTGGITVERVPFFQALPVSVIIAGRAIHQAPDPLAAAREIRATIARVWGGAGMSGGWRSASPAPASGWVATAAKAIRWGVSEMGLLLTVDGRECPGCDSPARLCQASRTEIYTPPGVNAADVVAGVGRILGPGGAFGQVSDHVFYLDPAHLGDLSARQVTGLLLATGNALRGLGCAVDVTAGVGVANQILASG